MVSHLLKSCPVIQIWNKWCRIHTNTNMLQIANVIKYALAKVIISHRDKNNIQWKHAFSQILVQRRQYTLCGIPCTMCSIPHTMNSKPYTLCGVHYTLLGVTLYTVALLTQCVLYLTYCVIYHTQCGIPCTL